MRLRINDRIAFDEWEEFRRMVFDSTTVDPQETEEQKAARIKELQKPGNEEAWMRYYFPKYCFKPSAAFHRRSTKKFLGSRRFRQWRKWFRGSSKSTRRMMEVFYSMFVQAFRTNCLLISKTAENAERLLAPYRANLEANQRLINDYGNQEKPGSWTGGEFITRSGHAFRACGAEQNPRGTRLDELRVTLIIFDDIDDDEVCRNPDRVQQRIDWIERAVIPTVDISGEYRIVFDNNLISENSCAAWFGKFADDVDEVNIRDENGQSSWPEKNSEADIDDMLKGISYAAAQAEYFNNPYTEGQVFKELTFGKCPPLSRFPFVVIYADPSPSNRDKPGIKSKAFNSCKAVVIVGCLNNIYYVLKCWVDNTNNSTFIDWLYAAFDWVAGKTQPYVFIENNTLQNPFYEQVLLPLIHQKGKEMSRAVLPVTPDTRDKPDKFFRIEGNLEPINRLGQLVFNEAEKTNPHMERMIAQFKSVRATSKTMDGPDATEGAIHIVKQKTLLMVVDDFMFIQRPANKKRY